MVLAVLLQIGGTEKYPAPNVEERNAVRLLCTVCGRNLNSGIQCELFGRWYHYSWGNEKAVAPEKEKIGTVLSVVLKR
jgi:hypothetical protein